MSLRVDISKTFGAQKIAACFEAPKGVTALFGPSGAGKTTIIQSVAGLMRPDTGRIDLDGGLFFDAAQGVDVPVHKRALGYVFQDARLFPHLSVTRNLRYGRRARGLSDDPKLEAEVVEMLGLGGLLRRMPANLSGGEVQRVALGRALLSEPRVLLLDEPLAALDGHRKEEILPYFERLRDAADMPILYVSHDISEVARLANHVVLMRAGEVQQQGPVQAVFSDIASASALGIRETGAVLSATLVAQHSDGLSELECSAGRLHLPAIKAEIGDKLRLRIKSSDVMLSLTSPSDISALNVMPCEVSAIRFGDGPGALVQLRAGGETLLARVTKRSAVALDLRQGKTLFAVIKSVSVARADIGAG